MKKFLLSLLVVIVLFGSFGCNKKEKEKEVQQDITDDVAVFDDQKVNEILFQDAVIVYEEGKSTLTMTIINEGEKTVYIDTVNIKLYNNDELVQEFNSGVGSNIEAKSTIPLVQEIMRDISKTNKIEYKINS